MCFFKILPIISSTPPSQKQQPFSKGIIIYLDLRFSFATEESQSSRSDSISAAAQATTNNEEEEALPEKVNNKVNNHVETKSEEEGNENAKTASFREGDGNKAAKVISEKDESDSKGGELQTRRASREKQKERWAVVDLYDNMALLK
ncbi:hypothetical protein E2542_SST04226 [Spatholobus suberectus]|nr:hypothetical protein E2542_SST04226 [Spatholobus suberectus]